VIQARRQRWLTINIEKIGRIWQTKRIARSVKEYLSNKARIQRFGCTFWITNKGLISEMMKMASSDKTITTIVSWTTDDKNPCMFTHLVNLY
jgi:hypothetical protein